MNKTQLCAIQVNDALKAPLYRANDKTSLDSLVATLILLLHEKQRNGETAKVNNRIFEQLNAILSEGNDPTIDGYRHWDNAVLACVLLLVKKTPSVWDHLTEKEHAKISCMMRAFAFTTNFVVNDQNNYRTALDLRGDCSKYGASNFKLAFLSMIICPMVYFGGKAEDLNPILRGFNFDKEISEMKEHGMTNTIAVWLTDGFDLPDGTHAPSTRELMEKGGHAWVKTADGQVYAGDYGKPSGTAWMENKENGIIGVGVAENFMWNRHRTVKEVCEDILAQAYSGGFATSYTDENDDGIPEAYIEDGTDSPVVGQYGMMLAFNSKDSGGLRSSARYAKIEFILATAVISTLKEVGAYSTSASLTSKISVGNEDLFYKLAHGYHCVQNGFDFSMKDDGTDLSYNLCKGYYINHLK